MPSRHMHKQFYFYMLLSSTNSLKPVLQVKNYISYRGRFVVLYNKSKTGGGSSNIFLKENIFFFRNHGRVYE
jgi:hypothetical protein